MHDRSKYREPCPGDLADIRQYNRTAMDTQILYGALILSYASSNVYEPSSCEVYHGGDIFWVESKYLTLHPRD